MTSRENLELLKRDLDGMSDAELIRKALAYAARPEAERVRWEVRPVDVWIARDGGKFLAMIDPKRVSELTTPGLERLAQHLEERLDLIRRELSQRTPRGAPSIPDTDLYSLIYAKLIARNLVHEAKQFCKKLDVSERTLKRHIPG